MIEKIDDVVGVKNIFLNVFCVEFKCFTGKRCINTERERKFQGSVLHFLPFIPKKCSI